ncbi:hypothetical protein [Dyella mobilis]|uniref:Uncharacterized protein n=1 Tax=Dyella mobilis TaxID=1849582 RepID=A0ABS2KDG6_9GAMM|nr:hypothetical protein [Dyella mobilis]MBM7128817.1 hypothetical protein [Dyella mobilis]GLQ99149.1 hypothetical protein GCM10007863_35690 [Dyella mobilis]
MKAFVFSILVTLFFIAMPALAAPPDKDLRAAVDRLAALTSDGYATLYAEQTAAIPERSSRIVAVFFVLEGPGMGNGYWQFLAFFERNETAGPKYPPAHAYRLLAFRQVGARETRSFDAPTASFQNGILTVSGHALGPNDPMCCPSVPVRAVFKLEDGAVVEQQAGR